VDKAGPEVDETILMRLTVDTELKRLLLKGRIKKVWTSAEVVAFEKGLNGDCQMFIDVRKEGFVFGIVAK